MVLLYSYQGVFPCFVLRLLLCSGELLGCCHEVACVLPLVLLECTGWLPEC